MTFNETINMVTLILIGIFDVGMIVRILKIIMDGQTDEDQPTGKMVMNHVKAAIIVNISSGLILVIKRYYM